MIGSPLLAKTVAVSVAVVVHGSVLAVVFDRAEIEIDGGSGGVQASIGNSFADMAAGVMLPDAAEEFVENVPPRKETPDVKPDKMLEKVSPDMVAEPDTIAETKPVAVAEKPVEPLPEPVALSPNVPLAPITPAQDAATDAVHPEQVKTLAPSDDAPAAVVRSLRPKTRSAEFERAHEARPPKVSKPNAQDKRLAASKPKGNARQNAKTGTATGTQMKKTSSDTGTGRAASGNAAVSNYPGKVMRRISQVSRPRVGSKGTAVVAFRVASNGGLAAVSLARSSGSAKLDRAALGVIRRAAPFPPPPPGARRSFSIKIKGI